MAEQANWREDTLIGDRVMDGVILAAGMIISLIAIVSLLIGEQGSKGITKEYKTKSGTKRTAKKSREQHIV